VNPPAPPAPPTRQHHRWTFALLGVVVLMYVAAFGAQRLREEHIYRPVCERVCGKRGLRYENIEQARKSDRAVACRCVGAVIKTHFFSDNAILEFIAGEATSTFGVICGPMLLFGAGVLVWARFSKPKT
jgi:hypothetical protein